MTNFREIVIYLIGFVWVVIAGNQVSKLFQKIRLPLITGFLLSGIVVGPYILNLITCESISNLHFINDISLAFIAFAAGAELYIKEIRHQIKSIIWNTFGQFVIAFLFGSLSVLIAADYIPFMKDMAMPARIAVAILTGTIFIARSPSSAIAVINEMRAKGRFTKTAISVTIIKDVLVIVLFAACLSIANTLIKGRDFTFYFVLFLLLELSLTVFIGFLLSKVLNIILSFRINNNIKTLLILLSGYSVYVFSHILWKFSSKYLPFELIIESLLVCITASFLVANYSKYKVEFHRIIDKAGLYVYAAFFTLTGAMMSIEILLKTWTIALFFFVVRFTAIIIGAYMGSTLAGDPKLHRKINWMPYITQAGVGLALVLEVAMDFPEWGNQFATIIIAVIVLNQLIGPPLFKWSIKLAGESHIHSPGDYEGTKDVLILGYENQSVTLAKGLTARGYNIRIATLMESAPDVNNIEICHIKNFENTTLKTLDFNIFERIILMLPDDENFHICEYIYENIGTKTVIVRLHDHTFFKRFHELGALIVYPATTVVNMLEHLVLSPGATSLILGMESDKGTVDIEVQDKSMHGIALRDLRLPADVLVLSVKRREQMIISHGYTRLRLGDIVTMVGSIEDLQNISLQFEREYSPST